MLRETLKREIDQLSDNQLGKIAELVQSIKINTEPLPNGMPFWQRSTPEERVKDFRAWITQLPTTDLNLVQVETWSFQREIR